MAGGTEDLKDNRQDKTVGSLRNNSAGFLLLRLKYLINRINVSLGLMSANSISPSFSCTDLIVDESLSLRVEISEFLGLACYMQGKYKKLLLPYQLQITRLKIKLGYYFI